MPKFYKQNKRRIDPRYFLEETVEEEILTESDDECWCEDSSGNKVRDFIRNNGQGCRGSETKKCPEHVLEPEVKAIKNRHKKIDDMFKSSGVYTTKRGIR